MFWVLKCYIWKYWTWPELGGNIEWMIWIEVIWKRRVGSCGDRKFCWLHIVRCPSATQIGWWSWIQRWLLAHFGRIVYMTVRQLMILTLSNYIVLVFLTSFGTLPFVLSWYLVSWRNIDGRRQKRQKMRKMWKLLIGAMGRKPILDDTQIFLAEFQYRSVNESFTDVFNNAIKNLRYLTISNVLPRGNVTLTAIVLKMRYIHKSRLIFRVIPLVVCD